MEVIYLMHRSDCSVLQCCLSIVTLASISSRCIDEIYDALAERILPPALVASNPNLK